MPHMLEVLELHAEKLKALQTAWLNYDQYDTDDHPEIRHQAWLKLRDALRDFFGGAK